VGRIKDHPAHHDDLAHPVAKAAAEPDRWPAAMRLSHRQYPLDTARLDDSYRVVGQLVMAEIGARTTRVPVTAPVQPDHPMPDSQALGEQGEKTPAAGTPPR
jgi:hypothetical protein